MGGGTTSENADHTAKFEFTEKIGVLSVMQESNSFSPRKTSIGNFAIASAIDIQIRKPEANSEFEGALDEITRCCGNGIPIFNAFALPSGPIDASSLAELLNLLRHQLVKQTPLDGLVMCLHGAMLDEFGQSADVAILRMVRNCLGNSIPVAVSLDLHANMTSEFLDLTTVISGYKTNPHIDQRDTGRRVARLLARVMSGNLRPVMHLEKCPAIFPDETLSTSSGMLADILRKCTLSLHPSIVDVSVFPCQPWIDSPGVGFAALCISDENRQPAAEMSRTIVDQVWQQRHKFKIAKLATPVEAIKAAEHSLIRPFIIAESADAPTAGAAGDSPAMIKVYQNSNTTLQTLIPITDAQAVKKCYEHQVGSVITLSLGCSVDPRWWKPVSVTGEIVTLGAGNYKLSGSGYHGMEVSMGRFAVIRCKTMKILITETPCWSADPATWNHAQLNPREAELLVVRSCSDFRANFPDSSESAITLDVVGPASTKFTELPYEHCHIGIWPMDTTATYRRTN